MNGMRHTSNAVDANKTVNFDFGGLEK